MKRIIIGILLILIASLMISGVNAKTYTIDHWKTKTSYDDNGNGVNTKKVGKIYYRYFDYYNDKKQDTLWIDANGKKIKKITVKYVNINTGKSKTKIYKKFKKRYIDPDTKAPTLYIKFNSAWYPSKTKIKL